MRIVKQVERMRKRGYEIVQILRRGVIMQREIDGKSLVLNRKGDLVTTILKVPA